MEVASSIASNSVVSTISVPNAVAGCPVESFRRSELRKGLNLFTLDCMTALDPSVDITTSEPMLIFYYQMTGKGVLEFHSEERHEVSENMGYLIYLTHKLTLNPGQENSRAIAIGINREELMNYMDSNDLFSLSLPKDSQYIQSHILFKKMNPHHLNQMLQSLYGCPHSRSVSRLFLEAKILEILALELSGYQSENHNPIPSMKWKKMDIKLLNEARSILLNRMDDPPNLNELSRLVGLNQLKLKKGFREIFGTTVYGYLRKERMLKAKQLFDEKSMNVLEAAMIVGYSNPAHFATAFRKEFGINPGKYKYIK